MFALLLSLSHLVQSGAHADATRSLEIPDEVTAIETAAIEAREKLLSGRFDIKKRHTISGPGIPEGTAEERLEAVVFRGDSVRWTQFNRYGGTTVCIYHEGTFSRRTLSNNADPSVDTAPHVQYGLSGRPDAAICDPRQFGLFGGDIIGSQHLEMANALVAPANRISATLTQEQLDNRDVRHIRSRREPRSGVDRGASVWIDSERGYSPVKIQFDDEHDGEPVGEVTEFQLREFSGVWFPEVIKVTRTMPEKEIVEIKEISFSNIQLNIDIDDSEFSLAKLEPKVGDLIIETPPQDPTVTRVWDGQKPVSRLPDLALGRPDVPSSLNWRPWVIAGSSLLGAVFTTLWLRERGRGPGQQKSAPAP
jgi:hypothetical protein